MKQFKNSFVVTGIPELLIAFHDLMIKEGHADNVEWNKLHNPSMDCNYLKMYCYSGIVQYHNHDCDLPTYKLPKQWEEAYKLGIEVVGDKFKVGDWVQLVKIDNSNCIITDPMRIANIDDYNMNIHPLFCYNYKYRLATPEEIKAHLIKVLESKGIVEGSKIIGVRDVEIGECLGSEDKILMKYNKNINIKVFYIKYYPNIDTFITYGDGGVGILYEKGVFCTLKEEPKLTIAGYNVEIPSSTQVKIGCRMFTNHEFIETVNTLHKAEISRIVHMGKDILISDLIDIAHKLNHKKDHPHVAKLKELGVYEQFMTNFNNDPKFHNNLSFDAYLNKYSDNWKKFITYAFNWLATSEGHSLWDVIYYK
jgi:hypothetical protein